MIRVIVAEDHTIVREGIKQLIGLAKDMQVIGEAGNGQQLLDQLRQTSCDVVLLDISMPGVSGLEAIPRIRALSDPPAILVLSMHDEAQMAARALKVGAAGYATKDSDPALLLTAAISLGLCAVTPFIAGAALRAARAPKFNNNRNACEARRFLCSNGT